MKKGTGDNMTVKQQLNFIRALEVRLHVRNAF